MNANTDCLRCFITVYLESNLSSTCNGKVRKNRPLTQKVLHQTKFNGRTNACSQKMAPSSSIDQDGLNIEDYNVA